MFQNIRNQSICWSTPQFEVCIELARTIAPLTIGPQGVLSHRAWSSLIDDIRVVLKQTVSLTRQLRLQISSTYEIDVGVSPESVFNGKRTGDLKQKLLPK